jgi:hypothetical protein
VCLDPAKSDSPCGLFQPRGLMSNFVYERCVDIGIFDGVQGYLAVGVYRDLLACCVCVCVYVCMYDCTYVCMYVCMYYVCMYVCMYYVCMYVFFLNNDLLSMLHLHVLSVFVPLVIQHVMRMRHIIFITLPSVASPALQYFSTFS